MPRVPAARDEAPAEPVCAGAGGKQGGKTRVLVFGNGGGVQDPSPASARERAAGATVLFG